MDEDPQILPPRTGRPIVIPDGGGDGTAYFAFQNEGDTELYITDVALEFPELSLRKKKSGIAYAEGDPSTYDKYPVPIRGDLYGYGIPCMAGFSYLKMAIEAAGPEGLKIAPHKAWGGAIAVITQSSPFLSGTPVDDAQDNYVQENDTNPDVPRTGRAKVFLDTPSGTTPEMGIKLFGYRGTNAPGLLTTLRIPMENNSSGGPWGVLMQMGPQPGSREWWDNFTPGDGLPGSGT